MDDIIKIRMLASSSSGNSIFVRVGQTRLLIDAGVSCRRIKRGLEDIGESIDELSAVLLTHEHTDHTKGLHQIFKRWPSTPLFCSAGTLEAASKAFDRPANWTRVVAERPFRIEDVTVEPFKLMHDASEPCGFRLDAEGFSVGIATDLGHWNEAIAQSLEACQVLVLEANYDLDMLRSGPYPAFLKRRISGSDGHLSNDQARALLSRIAHPQLEQVILAHLSEKNNLPELAIERVGAALGSQSSARITAADPKAGELFEFVPNPSSSSTRAPSQGVLL